MARIPEAEIERIKREIDLTELVVIAGVELRAHGDNLLGLCPMHDDHTPSLVVTPARGLWNCLGACQAGGSVIDWVMKQERVSFRHAIEILRAQLIPLAASSLAAEVAPRNKPAINLNADDQTLLNETVAYYCDHIGEARAYLASRGLDDEEMINHFHLGFSNRTLGYYLPHKRLKAGKEIRARLTEIGLLRESGFENFAGSLIIPIFDEAGNVTEIYGRKVTSGLRKGTPLHIYLKGPHRGVWNWQGLVAAKEVILCEALIDALTIWRAGFHNVTASYGINGFTKDHLNTFSQYGAERVLIAYDRDEAGDLAAQQLAEKLADIGIECYRIEFPAGMDANEYARQHQPTSAQWQELIAQARLMAEAKPVIVSKAALNEAEITIEPIIESTIEPVIKSAPAQATSNTNHQAEKNEQLENSPAQDVPIEIKGEDIFIFLGDREYRVRGLSKNLSTGQMKVNVRLSWRGDAHQDTVDLCVYRGKKDFSLHAQTELGIKAEIVRRDLALLLNKLEALQDEQIKQTLEPKEQPVILSPIQEQAALALLKDPGLIERIKESFQQCGIVGEQTNMLVGYLGAVSRKLEHPLAILIQSSSAAGKTSLMEAVLAFMPKEEQVKYSAMTGQALFYLGDINVKNKIMAFSEEEGAQRASYAIKLLQSEGELTIASTGKDPVTGRMVTHQYRVEGPVMLFTTTTAIDIDEELKNRCIVLIINEEREQTRAIHQMQREQYTAEGLIARRKRKQILELHQNAQRLLKPISVINPYSRRLTFIDNQTRARRDHMKYLGLINTIAFLHQYQRPRRAIEIDGVNEECVIVTLTDIEMANEMANEILGRSLDDMPPQTRRFLMQLDEMAKERSKELRVKQGDYRFTQREVREHTGLSNTQVKMHLTRLAELEYVIAHRGGRGQQFVYELVYDGEGKDGKPFLVGLIDVKELENREYDNKWSEKNEGWSEQNSKWSDTGRGQVGVKSGSKRG
jgi:DNA primase catalytic core